MCVYPLPLHTNWRSPPTPPPDHTHPPTHKHIESCPHTQTERRYPPPHTHTLKVSPPPPDTHTLKVAPPHTLLKSPLHPHALLKVPTTTHFFIESSHAHTHIIESPHHHHMHYCKSPPSHTCIIECLPTPQLKISPTIHHPNWNSPPNPNWKAPPTPTPNESLPSVASTENVLFLTANKTTIYPKRQIQTLHEILTYFFINVHHIKSLLIRRGAVVKRVEHISTIVLVNIWVAQVRVPLVLSVGIWICKNSNINA